MDEEIIIKRGTEAIYAAPLTKDSVRKYELMKEDSLTLVFSTGYADVPTFEIGDAVEWDGETYVLQEQTAPKYNATTGGYDFSLVFVAEYMSWSHLLMKSVRLTTDGRKTFGETDWNLTAQLMDHACAILRCVNLHAGIEESDEDIQLHVDIDYGYVAGAYEYKHVGYSSTNIIDAISELCKTERYDCEWWVTRAPETGAYTLHFGRLGDGIDGTPYVIRQGLNGIITRQSSQTKYSNRIYVYGGTQNVPYSYRKQVWLTNEREDGKLWDKERVITFDMLNAEKRLVPFEIPILSISRAQEYGYKGGSISTAIIGYSASKTFLDIPRGKYRLHLSQIAARFGVRLKGYRDIGFDECRILVTFGYDTSYHSVFDVTKYLDAQGHTIGLSGFATMEDEDVEIILKENTWLMIDFSVRLLFPFDAYDTYNPPIKQYEQSLQESADFSLFQTDDNQILERLDYEDMPIKVCDKSGNEYDAFFRSTIDGDEIFSTTATFQHGEQYTISPLVDSKVGYNFYTPDDGADVINGLTEMRLRLPADERKTVEGYISHNGYIETEAAATGGPIVESSVTHDDVYPSVVSMPVQAVDDSETREATTTYSDGTTQTQEYKVYRVYAKMTNGKEGDARQEYDFTEDYLLHDVGNKLGVKFTTGQLAGMEFEAIFDDETEYQGYRQSYLIVPNKNYGAQLPNEKLHPNPNEEMLLLGWNPQSIASLGLVETAEERLLEEAVRDIKNASEGNYTYNVSMIPDTSEILANLADADGELLEDIDGEQLLCDDIDAQTIFDVGSAVTLVDPSLFQGESEPLRIIGYEMHLDYEWDSTKYIIGEIPKPSRTKTLERKTNELETKLQRK